MGVTRNAMREERGFTLIELLVVIMIIGILAAIALPAFLGQRSKAQDSDAKSNARNMVTQIEACFVEQQDYENCDTEAELPNTSLPMDVVFPPTSAGKVAAAGQFTRFTVVALSKSGNTFTLVHNDQNIVTRTCSDINGGGCATAGTW